MVSSTINVVRYSALVGGVLYGIMHRRTLQAQKDLKKEHHLADRREELIQKARQAWKEKTTQSVKGDGVITDPEDSRFDLEKLLLKWEKEYS